MGIVNVFLFSVLVLGPLGLYAVAIFKSPGGRG